MGVEHACKIPVRKAPDIIPHTIVRIVILSICFVKNYFLQSNIDGEALDKVCIKQEGNQPCA